MSITESCLSVAIISAVTMIAVPSLMKSRENYVLNATARQVASHMNSTRIKAISRNRDCRVRVTSPVSYLIECEDPVWKPVEWIVLPRGLLISANAHPEFHRRGNVSPAATITIQNSNGRLKQVIVNITGRVRVR